MWNIFIFQNAHFAISLFAALVCFAIFWLYLDAWWERKPAVALPKIIGWLVLALSLAGLATTVEEIAGFKSFLAAGFWVQGLEIARWVGYLLIAGSVLEPLPVKPKKSQKAFVLGSVAWGKFFLPITAVVAAWVYLRRATVGLENHLKPVALGLFIWAVSELVGLAILFRDTTNIDIYNMVASFGLLWLVQYGLLLIGSLVLGKWVFGYLLKRIQTQLFMIFTVVILTVFLVTTVAFTGLLLKNIQDEALVSLKTNAAVLAYGLNSLQNATSSDAQVLAQNTQIQMALQDGDKSILTTASEEVLLAKRLSSLVITDATGVVLVRGENRDRRGDSLSDDRLVKRAILGESVASVVTHNSVLADAIAARSAVPVKLSTGEVVGVVVAEVVVNDAFMDGLKRATGLEASVYVDDKLSASSLVLSDGKTRPIGTALPVGAGGSVNLLNTPYFAAELEVLDVDQVKVGTLWVGRPQVGVFAAAARSVELTFLIAVAMMAIAIVPAGLISRYITNQIQ